VADEALRGRRGLVTGANEDDWHYRNVDVSRDIDVAEWADLREVVAGETCTCGDGTLELWKGIEVGHIFKLGTKYSVAMNANVQDPAGVSRPVVMGCYGIGVERNMAAIVEASHDDKGILWPKSVAPIEVVITEVRADDEGTAGAATQLHSDLTSAGVEVLLDDRVERPGVKFADAELVGIPLRITVGPRGVASGTVELTTRATSEAEDVSMADVVGVVAERVAALRRR
jgi:prolyl-tRNA synthetase